MQNIIIEKWKGECPKLIKYYIYDTFVNVIHLAIKITHIDVQSLFLKS
jgi:hypothetical protein